MLRYILLRKKGYLYKAVWKLYRNRKNSFDVLKITFFYEAFFQKQFITKVNRIVSRKKIISSNWFFFKFSIHLLLKYSESILYTHGLKLILFQKITICIYLIQSKMIQNPCLQYFLQNFSRYIRFFIHKIQIYRWEIILYKNENKN